MRKKTCKECGMKFVPTRPMQPVCDHYDCKAAYAIKAAQKSARRRESAEKLRKTAERKEIKARKEKLKGRRDYLKECQIAFNSYIRERDKDKPCICCGKPLNSGEVGGGFDCGHYRSVGSAPHLRFDPRNAHGQRKQCNRWGAGRAVDYRLGLIERIGLAAVEDLESTQDGGKWSISDLKKMKEEFNEMRRELLRAKSVCFQA